MKQRGFSLNPRSGMRLRLAGYAVALGALLIGSFIPAAFTPTLIVFLLLLGVLLFSDIIASPHWVTYSVGMLIISVTIQRERLGIPFEVDLLGFGLLATALLIRLPWRTLISRWPPFFWIALAYVLINFAATFINASDLPTSLRQSLILVYRLAMFVLAAVAVQAESAIRAVIPGLLVVLMVLQTLVGLVALLLYPRYPTPFVHQWKFGSRAIALTGFFQEPNIFGIFCLCVTAIMLPWLLLYGSRARAPLLGAAGIGMLGIALSYTRSSWLGLLIVVLCLAAVSVFTTDRRTQIRFFAMSALLLLVLLAGAMSVMVFFDQAGFFSDRLANLVSTSTSSTSGRITTWQQAIAHWQGQRWIGWGPLSFGTTSTTERGWLYSSVIQALHDSGLIGLALMLWFCGACALYTLRGWWRADNPLDRSILLGYALAQIALFFTSQFSSLFWNGFTWVLLGVSVGHAHWILRSSGKIGPASGPKAPIEPTQ